jgi:hypothetical protein
VVAAMVEADKGDEADGVSPAKDQNHWCWQRRAPVRWG